MENFWLHLGNWVFIVFHTVLIVFNLFGWIFLKTRKLHLFTLAVTLFSWLVLGIWKGFGYCFLTDWHYDILRKLGKTNLPNSYITFLVENLSGWRPDAQLVEILTLVFTLLALICSLWVNFFNRKKNNFFTDL
ncbi:DUF2784 family protein [Aequorivita vladivostokensis]|uniref:DUF2784 domain-containing protein n=1 Tax=Aequorivita vladivostokensis TaxID=171194 RepID=A0ABR5DGV9_9FLAO|nr:DUF2784 family protein [Aequorivita vladivostokensis]KJJ38002.1 hypothetical protein MB09_11230 [Aequorivita vladivostokensis]